MWQKLRLIKIQSDILYKNGKNSADASAPIVITEEDRKWAEDFLKNQTHNEKEYE